MLIEFILGVNLFGRIPGKCETMQKMAEDISCKLRFSLLLSAIPRPICLKYL
jgi:hypothetical protein